LQVFLPINTGALSTVYPADIGGVAQYVGTSNSLLGLTRTKTITVRDWTDLSNDANMTLYAQEWLSSCQDVVYEGSLPYFGLLSSVLAPGTSINLAAPYPTGWETAAIPIVAIDLEFNESPGGTSYTTVLQLSSRRQPYSGAAFARPGQTGAMLGLQEGGTFGVSPEGFGEGLESTRNSLGDSLESAGDMASHATTTDGTRLSDLGSMGPGDTSALGPSQGTGPVSIPTSTEDMGLPTSMEDLGLPTSPAQFFGFDEPQFVPPTPPDDDSKPPKPDADFKPAGETGNNEANPGGDS
jgi:hypothetical protein